jgi:hypothetical protein
MALDSTHPQYSDKKADWVTMRDLYKGERHVKDKGETYLPATKSMKLDGMGTSTSAKPKLGQEVYNAYKLRAVLPDYVKDAVEIFIGMLHKKPPVIELPPQLEPLRERSTMHGEPLDVLLRRINEEQLVSGRLGLLLDLPKKPDPANPTFYIALYIAEAVRNWDDGNIEEGEAQLNLVILDESGFRRDANFEWQQVSKYRVLELRAENPDVEGAAAVYHVGVFEAGGGVAPVYDPTKVTTPMLRGQQLEEIPFVFVNSKDIVPAPDEAPLMTLGRQSLTIYRGEADYRQNLFMQGQDTLVISGDRKKATEDPTSDEPMRTGAGSVIELEAGGTAEYVGVNSQGLSEQRTALENDRKRAEARSGQLVNATGGGDKESGEALKTRVGAQAASLKQIALTGAAALEALLRAGARWVGADETKVKVTPNLEFADVIMSAAELAALMGARTMGAPISEQSIHARMVDGGLTKMTYEEERELVDQEIVDRPPPGTDAGGDDDEDAEVK